MTFPSPAFFSRRSTPSSTRAPSGWRSRSRRSAPSRFMACCRWSAMSSTRRLRRSSSQRRTRGLRQADAIARRRQAAGVDLDILVRRGEEPFREIIAEAQRCNADLIVARRRGKRGFLAKLMVGEMVGKVATLAPCSVLLVPRAGRMWTQRVLAGVDGSAAAQRAAEIAAQIALRCDLPLLVASAAVHDTARRSRPRRKRECFGGRDCAEGRRKGREPDRDGPTR